MFCSNLAIFQILLSEASIEWAAMGTNHVDQIIGFLVISHIARHPIKALQDLVHKKFSILVM